jgi:hypothetical protein
MQTTHKIPGDSATRYAKYLTSISTRGDYYIRDGDPDQPVPSRWHGSPDLLNSLGLDPEKPVARSDLRAVMQGFSPLTGEPLRPAGSDGTSSYSGRPLTSARRGSRGSHYSSLTAPVLSMAATRPTPRNCAELWRLWLTRSTKALHEGWGSKGVGCKSHPRSASWPLLWSSTDDERQIRTYIG